MIYLVTEILICFFAVIGITCTAIGIFDSYTASKTGVSAKLHIVNIENPQNGEYALRIIEGHLSHSVFGGFTDEIIVEDDSGIDDNVIKKLSAEYGNITKKL